VLFIHDSKFKVANEKPDTDALWCYFKASALYAKLTLDLNKGSLGVVYCVTRS